MPRTQEAERVAGVWIHPAEGENYPAELRMTVTEERQGLIDAMAWTTVTDYSPQGMKKVSRWSYLHLSDTDHLSFSAQRPDGTWVNMNRMSQPRWTVRDGTHAEARRVMRRFFTDGGWEYRGRR